MVQKARVRLLSGDLPDLQRVCQEIQDIAEKTNVKMYGPVHLPTKHLKITTRKSPCGEGTNTWEHFELRIHKRLIDIAAGDRSMVLIMKIKIPESVLVEIEVI
ncbi:MAG: 30S ribosomal protein S10 [Promethearchaeota archaeon]